MASGVASQPVNLVEGSNILSIAVTAEDGATTKTYTVDVTRQSPPVLGNDATLSNLQLTAMALDQVFQPNLESYSGTVGFLNTSTSVIADVADASATLTIDSVATNSGESSEPIHLSAGSNVISVVVTAEDGVTTKTYLIDITRQANASFAQQAYIKASNPGADDRFGLVLAVDGDLLAVGSALEDSSATGINGNQMDDSATSSGAVYVYSRDGSGVWAQEAYIKASDATGGAAFGRSVALYDDVMVVGAAFADKAYVFERDAGGNWSEKAILRGSSTETGDTFGLNVAVYQSTIAVSAYSESGGSSGVNGNEADNSLSQAGAVYIFGLDGSGAWTQQAYLKASNPDIQDYFGIGLALHDNTLVVGSADDSNGTNQSDNSLENSGAVYVFVRDALGNWGQQSYLKASNTEDVELFGVAVAIDGDLLAVGASYEDGGSAGVDGNQSDNSVPAAGAVYLFQ